jgi:hypothetical protein
VPVRRLEDRHLFLLGYSHGAVLRSPRKAGV